MKKIRLTERNLQNLIGKVVNETKKMKNTKIRLTEKKVEVWCECGDNEGCYGSWGGGSSMNCKCCDELINWDKDRMAPSDGPMGNDIELDMATDIMRETYKRLKKSRK
tara:strand:+ start:1744 stop:2067 length:324 start_codon:yes stop_codon:yes gene_type:complete